MDNEVRATVITEMRKTSSPSVFPAWRTTLFLVEGLTVAEAFVVVDKLALSKQRGFPKVRKTLLENHPWLGGIVEETIGA